MAIDIVRGIAMVIMATDHASEAFNRDRPVVDSALFQGFDQPLPIWAFLFRWLSHFCAPAFLFLAGTGLALSLARRRAAEVEAWRIDFDLFVRGAIMLLVDATFINWFWVPGVYFFQVMYAFGLSFWAMIFLRRLSSTLNVVIGLVCLTVGEWTRTGEIFVASDWGPTLMAFLVNAGFSPVGVLDMEGLFCAYPAVPWIGVMAWGLAYGRWLEKRQPSPEGRAAVTRMTFGLGIGSLALFLVLRGANGFGNLGLYRIDGSIPRWVQTSKYPPSLTFVLSELAILLLLLAWQFFRSRGVGEPGRAARVLSLFGRSAFFFYLFHIAVLELAARWSGLHLQADWGVAMLAWLLTMLLAYPVCRWFSGLKQRQPDGFLRYF